ncbi:MAG: phospholipid carrier-dependent glycosyltransferase [Leptolyngbyaceae cyanobacterium]
MKTQKPWVRSLLVLAVIWLLGALFDRLWFWMDHSVPAWDQAEYLTGALNYWQKLQSPRPWSGDWWVEFWQLSSKIPPLVYISTAPFLALFGPGPDQSTLVNLLYSAILLGAVYTLGTYLFAITVGLWAAGITLLLPALAVLRLDYLMDYPLVALVTLCFTCLTLWRGERHQRTGRTHPSEPEEIRVIRQKVGIQSLPFPDRQTPWADRLNQGWVWLSMNREWVLAAATGVTLGVSLMAKQTALLFLLVPLFWAFIEILSERDWPGLGQGLLGLGLAIPIVYPWYRTNWLLILTASKRATVDSAIAEGDPSLASPAAWLYYLKLLPGMVSWPLLGVSLLGWLFFWRRSRVSSLQGNQVDASPKPRPYQQFVFGNSQRSLGWLLLFWVGAYLLSSLNINKDERYMAPSLPVLAVVLAYGISLLPRSWNRLRWGAVGLTGVLLMASLFPIAPTPIRQAWPFPYQHYARLGPEYPHAEVAAEVVKTEPYLRSTLGVLPSTAPINQHNINYYGQLQQGQVFGRQVGTRRQFVVQDGHSFSWFVTKTDDQGAIRQGEAQTALVKLVEQEGEFRLQKAWQLPDQSVLKLMRKLVPLIEVQPLTTALPASTPLQLKLVSVPASAPAGQPIPVTYRWVGSWDALQSGLVLLTWRKQGEPPGPTRYRWFHDHGIAMGNLLSQKPEAKRDGTFEVVERMAMLPPAQLPAGTYILDAVYLNRQTGKVTTLATPAVSLKIDPKATASPAPELDLVTQLRNLAATLPEGVSILDRTFDQIGRLGQYDPDQDFVTQTRQAMEYRLQQEPDNRMFSYTLALANVLKRRVGPAIAALEQVVRLDPKNPNAYAYLAFVNLYDLRPGPAKLALNTALQLNPNLPELYGLRGIASLMSGQVSQAWQDGQTYQQRRQRKP